MLDATSVSYYKVVKGTNKVRAMLFVAIVVVVVGPFVSLPLPADTSRMPRAKRELKTDRNVL